MASINRIDLRNLHTEKLSRHLKLGGVNPNGDMVSVNSDYIELNGHPVLPVMGEIHYSRLPDQCWEEAILKAKAAGINTLSSYVIWIHHEEDEGVFDWSGNRNLKLFAEIIDKHGLYFLPRIGPFVHGECRNGGLPDWLYGRPFEVRSNDERYLAYVERLYQEIGKQLSGLLFKDGGPVIGVQLENEFMGATAPWDVVLREGSESVTLGSGGEQHMMILKRLAIEAGLDVPLYTCTAWNQSPVPEDEMLPMQCDYAFMPWDPDPNYQQAPSGMYTFRRLKSRPCWHPPAYDPKRYPMGYCEIGCGVQITYRHRPVVPPESVGAAAVVKIGGGANILGFYMFHGGTNPVGKHSYTNEFTVPRLSYDFQAPIGEYGQIRESYKRLKLINLFLRDLGVYLAPMAVALPDGADQLTSDNTTSLRCSARAKDGSGFLFLNNYQDHVDMPDREEVKVALTLEDETIQIPMQEGITLKGGVSAIMPFNLKLGGVLLKYSTTQLICKISTNCGEHFFFFAPEGIRPEYVFDRRSVQRIEISGGDVFDEADVVRAAVQPGTDCVIKLRDPAGATTCVTTLSWEQALSFWKGSIRGRQHVLLCDGALIFKNEGIELLSRHHTTAVSIFPDVAEGLAASSGNFTTDQDGIFTRYSFSLPNKEIMLDVEALAAGKAVVRFPKDLLEEVDDVYLQVDYIGDTAGAYINGKLVADSFWNGGIWEIGLKSFAPEISGGEMVLVVAPVTRQSPAAKYLPRELAAKLGSKDDKLCEIRGIMGVAEHNAIIRKE